MKLIIGFVIGMLVLGMLVYLYLSLGYAPVATAAPALPFEKAITKMALAAKIRKEAPSQAVEPASPENLTEGARLYVIHCAVCHGVPGQPKTAIAAGMFPPPPELLKGKGVTDDPPGETYWKVANGIRLTGMPGFHAALLEKQMWQVSQFVANADKLPASVSSILKSGK